MEEYKIKKTKINQPKTVLESQGRDSFLTPRYAVKILIPYIIKNFNKKELRIWECAAGMENGFITKSLNYYLGKKYSKLSVVETDINGKTKLNHNFITDKKDSFLSCDLIMSNPPFSIKFDFIDEAFKIGKPFAFLIPFDMCGFLFDAFSNRGLQAIVPSRRIDYMTPNIVERVNDGVGIGFVNKIYDLKGSSKLSKVSDLDKFEKGVYENFIRNRGSFKSIEQIPSSLLKKYSSSDFHSFWAVGNFSLEKDFTFVELSLKDKMEIL